MAVDTTMTAAQAQKLRAYVEKAWQKLGSSEPYWSVLTEPRWKLDQIAYFQVPTYASGYAFDLNAYLDRLENVGMEMHFVPQHAIFDAALQHGMRPVETSPDGLTTNFDRWISTTFLLSKFGGRSA